MGLLNEEAISIVIELHPHSNVRTTYFWKTERLKVAQANTLNRRVGHRKRTRDLYPGVCWPKHQTLA